MNSANLPEAMIYLFWGLVSFYIFQFVAAGKIALGTKDSQKRSIAYRLFSTSKFTSTWATFATIFGAPVIISLSTILFENQNIKNSEALFYTCSSMLFVLITLELAVFNSIRKTETDIWQKLISTAFVLDLVSILLLYAAIKPAALSTFDLDKNIPANWSGLDFYVQLIGVAALLSSFMVVLCTIEAGKVQNEEAAITKAKEAIGSPPASISDLNDSCTESKEASDKK